MGKSTQMLKQRLSFCSCLRSFSVYNVLISEGQNIPSNLSQIIESKQSPYYFEDGLRKVYPYIYRYVTPCKGRWFKKKLLDMYSSEYALYPIKEYETRITKGLLKVNNKTVDLNYVLKRGDVMSSLVHKHELPVLACPINILFEDDNFLIIDKPPSIPMHPCGLYRENSLLHILVNEYNIHNIYLTHRLDRLTSGIVVAAKTLEIAHKVQSQMMLNNVHKEYICRVEGNFPEGSVICNEPIKQLYHKVGVNIVHPEGKKSLTEFKKVSYNGKSSVVLCKPYTGRTHQIRVHLQYLGYPIINDPVYNSFTFGPNKGKDGIIGKSINELLEDLLIEHAEEWGTKRPVNIEKSSENKNSFLCFTLFKMHYKMDAILPKYKKDPSRFKNIECCYFCKMPSQDPIQNRLGLFLHAYKYQGDGWEFKGTMPFWASEDWNIA